MNPIVIRLLSVPDGMKLPDFAAAMRAVLGWRGNLGYIVRVHGQEFNSFSRKTRCEALHELQFHPQEKFLYICDILSIWDWDIRVIDIQEDQEDDRLRICLRGRGAAPPEHCGGPTGYRLMLKRQKEGAAMSDPVLVEAGVQMLAAACPDDPPRTWKILRSALEDGFGNID